MMTFQRSCGLLCADWALRMPGQSAAGEKRGGPGSGWALDGNPWTPDIAC